MNNTGYAAAFLLMYYEILFYFSPPTSFPRKKKSCILLCLPPEGFVQWKIFLLSVTVMLIISSLCVCSSDTCCLALVFSLLSSIFHATESASILSVPMPYHLLTVKT